MYKFIFIIESYGTIFILELYVYIGLGKGYAHCSIQIIIIRLELMKALPMSKKFPEKLTL